MKSLAPDPLVTPSDVEQGKRALVYDGAWANVVGALSGGIILVGFALALDAGPLAIGALAAIPFFGQLAQIPAIGLVQRVRQRRKISVIAITLARIVILACALLPFLEDRPTALGLLILGQMAVAVLGAVSACSWNSWMHDLLPREGLGQFFARRLFWATTLALVTGLAGGLLVDHWPFGEKIYSYSLVFAVAGLAGFVSSYWLTRVPEPVMRGSYERQPFLPMLRVPLHDTNFRRLIIFMTSWNFAVNLSAPFLTTYLLLQLEFDLGVVVILWAISQTANAITLRQWGRLSDRLSNKAILALAAPVFLGCVLALPFTALPERHMLTLPLLALIHAVMGAATGGIGLATGNIGLKLAPEGQGTAYLASVSLFGSLAAGIAPIVSGLFADWFGARELSVVIHWAAPGVEAEALAMRLRRWEFFFAFSFAVGLYALHALTLVREEEEVSERRVVQLFALEVRRSMRSLSSVGGLRLATTFPFGRLVDRKPEEPGAAGSPS
ncbi:MFS transporter [Azospirillum thermophilum]|uniref:MFS transporter n=1 Tax=Azospirillum thermophilum TaxID=2202148 RepID=A0A2S2CWB2_9PROT|nr:MFS transporter [Azospirillum thermophilum]AWK88748.1 MFS transporter [Azospirillum thermophilum]